MPYNCSSILNNNIFSSQISYISSNLSLTKAFIITDERLHGISGMEIVDNTLYMLSDSGAIFGIDYSNFHNTGVENCPVNISMYGDLACKNDFEEIHFVNSENFLISVEQKHTVANCTFTGDSFQCANIISTNDYLMHQFSNSNYGIEAFVVVNEEIIMFSEISYTSSSDRFQILTFNPYSNYYKTSEYLLPSETGFRITAATYAKDVELIFLLLVRNSMSPNFVYDIRIDTIRLDNIKLDQEVTSSNILAMKFDSSISKDCGIGNFEGIYHKAINNNSIEISIISDDNFGEWGEHSAFASFEYIY